jgi:superfamily II DNA/RNA helicase
LIIDEADLILSYGYEEDLQKLLTHLPKMHQTLLMSATLTEVSYAVNLRGSSLPVIFQIV